jgi:hypothetical protein
MNQPIPPISTGQAVPPPAPDVSAPPKRRRWIYILLALFAVLILFVMFLPSIIAMPALRQRFLNLAFSRYNTQATVGDLSLSWFSPIAIHDLKLQPENTDRAAITVPSFEGNLSLLRVLFGNSLGEYHVSQPELYVHFDKEGTNISRLIRGMGNMPMGNRSAKLVIEDGRVLLQGQSAPQPWPITGINLNVAITPAAESSAGVPTLHGQQAQLLNQMDLTPEMCNDLLKFITPPLFQATQTSGKVSLSVDDFNWPLGKPDAAQVTGKLTLHSVDVVPGPLMQLVNNVMQKSNTSLTMQIAKDDVVAFNMHDGRVYHENLTFRLAAAQIELVVHSHGSVGIDETLDWFIELEFPKLEGSDLTGHPLMKLLSQKPTLHITGTLSQPQWKPDGLATQVLQTGAQLLQQRLEQKRQQSQQGQPTAPQAPRDSGSSQPAKP